MLALSGRQSPKKMMLWYWKPDSLLFAILVSLFSQERQEEEGLDIDVTS
jgi:hypothetical protein